MIELESTKLMSGHATGRHTFPGVIGRRNYQAFCCENGLLFLDIVHTEKMTNAKYAIIGGLLGGLVGTSIGIMMDQKEHEKKVGPPQLHTLATDEELFALARSRKHSFVVFYEEINWAKLQAPKLRFSKTLQGRLTIKAKGIGKKLMEIHDVTAMNAATEGLPSLLGDRIVINAQFDHRQLCYVHAS